MTTTSETPQSPPRRAVRLIFEYEGDRVRLVSEHPVDIAVTGFDLPQGLAPGYYVESRDAENRTVARVPAREAFSKSMEVFPKKPGDPITRVDVAQPKGAFTVVVPAPDTVDHVTIVQVARPAIESTKAGEPSAAAAAPMVTDLASFPLKAGK